MLEFAKTALPYLGIGLAGIVVWSVLKNGVPAAYSAVKGVFTKGAADVKALETRVTTLEKQISLQIPANPVVMPPAVGPVGPVGPSGSH